MIRDQALDKCRSGKLCRRLLREPALTLDQILMIARATEAADLQAEQMEAGTRQPPQIKAMSSSHTGYSRNRTQIPQRRGIQQHATCYCCGKSGHRAKDPKCPTNGKKCNECHKIGHFGSVCKSQNHAQSKNPTKNNKAKQLQSVDAKDSSEDEYLCVGETRDEQDTSCHRRCSH